MRRRGEARGGFSVWKPQPAIKDDPPSSLRFQVQNLSGGELQRVALTLCLGKPADVYLIDEPSAYLDSEQRLMAARVIKRCSSFSFLPSQRCSAVRLGQHPSFVVSGTSSTPRRRRLWWSTTSSWRHTWPTESSCLTAFPPGAPQPTRKSQRKLYKLQPHTM